jgi:hypothetical protein
VFPVAASGGRAGTLRSRDSSLASSVASFISDSEFTLVQDTATRKRQRRREKNGDGGQAPKAPLLDLVTPPSQHISESSQDGGDD